MRGFNFESETRSSLGWEMIRLLKEVKEKPKYVIFENVASITNKKFKNTLDLFKLDLKNMGYTLYDKILNAVEFGIPQTRRRYFLVAILNVWIISFEELVEHFRDVVSDLNIKNLHYDLKRKISIIDKILWNLQTRICENVEVLLLDSSYNVIYSIGKEFGQHYIEKIIYPDLNKIILCNSIDNVITLSSDKNYKRTKLYNINCLHFSDGKKVAGYNLMYPIIANKRLYGYLLFHTLNFDFNKHDYNYILSLIK